MDDLSYRLYPLGERQPKGDTTDFSKKGWVSGKGRSAVWRELPYDAKTIEPQFLMESTTFEEWPKAQQGLKIVGMSITSATNSRTVITTCHNQAPCNHALFTLQEEGSRIESHLLLSGVMNSLSFDFTTRQRVGGLNLSWFILDECPIPNLSSAQRSGAERIVIGAARLTFIHRRFAPEWLRLKQLYPDLASKEWKHWWAVTEADRLRLRVEIDALCADLYGLDPDDFDWIVRDDPTDPKGFYRVDRQLPFRERLTGLAAAAFRALKDGKWSAESAAKLTNDEFFDVIGIPEMTAGPDPLIRKRDGCHRWKPEEFGPDDPRHGWTWEDCWKDAVALLGSEEAVRQYVEEDQPKTEKEEKPDSPTDLFGDPLPPIQGRLF